MKVGLSMSFCIQDLIEHKVSILDVAFLSTSTKCAHMRDWDHVIESYKSSYWKKNPKVAETHARYFINKGLVIQPRLAGKILRYPTNWIDIQNYYQVVLEHSVNL